jgi:hypothetical protein
LESESNAQMHPIALDPKYSLTDIQRRVSINHIKR